MKKSLLYVRKGGRGVNRKKTTREIWNKEENN
jgi:hypothetical protein